MKKCAFWIAACLLSIVPLTVWMALKNTIIIETSIAGFRTGRNIFATIFVANFLCSFFQVVKVLKKNKATKVQNSNLDETPSEVDEHGPFDVSDRGKIQEQLKSMRDGKWKGIGNIDELYEIMDEMDSYQESLEKLLNQSEYLSDEKPVRIMEKLEDSIYINIKKLLNYMMVLQQFDGVLMRERIDDCIGKNKELLQKAKDFIIAVTDYVNRDMGTLDEQKALAQMNSYMYVVLEAIEQQDIRLN